MLLCKHDKTKAVKSSCEIEWEVAIHANTHEGWGRRWEFENELNALERAAGVQEQSQDMIEYKRWII